MAPFTNRKQAGIILGRRLRPYRASRPIVLALPRGGIPVAAEVAKALMAPLDVLAVKKIGAPHHEELALGAISEEGTPVFNEEVISALESRFGFRRTELQELARRKRAEVVAQVERFRAVRPALDLQDRNVILVDDGLATGATMEAAVQVLRGRGVRRIVVAVPVGAADSLARLVKIVDDVVCLVVPRDFYAVGAWYRDFSQLSDEEADDMLEERLGAENEPASSGTVLIPAGNVFLEGELQMPSGASALVIFAHGSGSSRKSPRNRQVAREIQERGMGTLLFDLLSADEASIRQNVFDIDLLSSRLLSAFSWAREKAPEAKIAFFGASTGAAAALRAAAQAPEGLFAVVSRGGRVDLAADYLSRIKVPVLTIVGALDQPVLASTLKVLDRLCIPRLELVNGAGHLFEEPGAIEEVARIAARWLRDHVPANGKENIAVGW
ncbi:MAG TPA: phosphoribosyltransferase family protein [Bdellovibrionota bacterium]